MPPRVEVDVEHLLVEPAAITIGDTATLSFDLRSREERPVPVLVDYVIHYVKADGSTSPTVFKLKALDLEPGSSAGLRRQAELRPPVDAHPPAGPAPGGDPGQRCRPGRRGVRTDRVSRQNGRPIGSFGVERS